MRNTRDPMCSLTATPLLPFAASGGSQHLPPVIRAVRVSWTSQERDESVQLASYLAVALLSLGVAAYAVIAYAFFPIGTFLHPDMRASFEAHRVVVYLHVFASALTLALGPFQFSARLRASRPELHRWMGRVYLGVGVLVGGVAGLVMAMNAYGGLASNVVFGVLAVLWLYTGLRAYLAIRARDIAAHRLWMIRNYALAFAAVTLRLWLPAAVVAGIDFDIAYPAIAWLCWVPNLVLAMAWMRRDG